jgi:hypothetical protein
MRTGSKIFVGFLICCAVVTAQAWASIIAGGELYTAKLRNSMLMIDFVKLYAGSAIVANGHGKDLYDPYCQLAAMNRVVQPNSYPTVRYIQYPPYDFVLASPLTLLPFPAAYSLWCIGTLLFGLAGVFYLRWASGGSLSIVESLSIIFIYYNSLFSMDAIMIGQTAWFMLGLVCFFFGAFLTRRDYLAGVMLAASTVKPQFLFCLLPLPIFEKRWRTLLVAFVLEILLWAGSIWAVGWDNVLHYPTILKTAEAQMFGNDNEYMTCLRGFLTVIMGRELGFYVSLACVSIGFALMTYSWYSNKRIYKGTIGNTGLKITIATFVLVYVIFSPHTFVYDCLLLAVPAILLLDDFSVEGVFQAKGMERWWRLLLFILPLISWLPHLLHKKLTDRMILTANLWLLGYLLIFLRNKGAALPESSLVSSVPVQNSQT